MSDLADRVAEAILANCRDHEIDHEDCNCGEAAEVARRVAAEMLEELDQDAARRERERVAKAIEDEAFRVFTDTDGDRSIAVHRHYEGLTLARDIARRVPDATA